MVDIRSVNVRCELNWATFKLNRPPTQQRGNLQDSFLLRRGRIISDRELPPHREALLRWVNGYVQIVAANSECFTIKRQKRNRRQRKNTKQRKNSHSDLARLW